MHISHPSSEFLSFSYRFNALATVIYNLNVQNLMSIIQIEPALLFDSNIYLVVGSDRTALIDTGTGFASDQVVERIHKALGERNLDIVILTHRHYDHVGGLWRIEDRFSPVVYAGSMDAIPLREGDSESTLGTRFGGSIRPTDVIDLNEGDIMDLGGHRLRCISTPGHTVGSICLFDEATSSLFSGDTAFIDGVGNTSHPTGSDSMLIESLKKLNEMEFKGFYPGHGPTVSKDGKVYFKKVIVSMGVVRV